MTTIHHCSTSTPHSPHTVDRGAWGRGWCPGVGSTPAEPTAVTEDERAAWLAEVSSPTEEVPAAAALMRSLLEASIHFTSKATTLQGHPYEFAVSAMAGTYAGAAAFLLAALSADQPAGGAENVADRLRTWLDYGEPLHDWVSERATGHGLDVDALIERAHTPSSSPALTGPISDQAATTEGAEGPFATRGEVSGPARPLIGETCAAATATAPVAAERPYATWDPSLATDEPDGLPDRAIVPLVEALRSRGVVTLQSCAGHPGTDDGCLWVRADSVDGAHLRLFVLDVVGRDVFDRVSLTYWPERRWEFVWRPENAGIAMAALGWLKPADTTTATSPSVAADLTEPAVTPGHPTQAGAGYDCMCGECQSLRVRSAEPVPVPDSVPGWDRDSINKIAEHMPTPELRAMVLALLADRDQLSVDVEQAQDRVALRESSIGELARNAGYWSEVAGDRARERDAARVELAEVTADRDRLSRLLAHIGDAMSPTGERPEDALSTLEDDVRALVDRADQHEAEVDRLRGELEQARQDHPAVDLDWWSRDAGANALEWAAGRAERLFGTTTDHPPLLTSPDLRAMAAELRSGERRTGERHIEPRPAAPTSTAEPTEGAKP